MPGMSGGTVALHLRRQAGSDGLTVIATSATDPDDSRLTVYGGLFDAYLVKPCDLNRLEELLAGRGSYAAC